MIYDVVIIGGGPAGMSAGLVAGRGKKQVLLIDEERPRNEVTLESHAFLTRDGISPQEFRIKGRDDLKKYSTIEIKNDRVKKISKTDEESFILTTGDGRIVEGKRVVLATGLKETLPEVKGIETFYGKSIFSCPFCDGWEMKDKPLIVIADTEQAVHVIKLVKNWSDDLIVATNGRAIFNVEQVQQLKNNSILLIEEKIIELNGEEGVLNSVLFEGIGEVERAGGFCTTHLKDETPFVKQLNLELNDSGFVKTDSMGRTSIKGVYAAGEITGPSQLIVSASQGHMTAAGIIMESSEIIFSGLNKEQI